MKISRSLPLSLICFGLLVASSNALAGDVARLTKENGPCMVLAHTFEGKNAIGRAEALARELMDDHGIPAYILEIPEDRFRLQPAMVSVWVGNCLRNREAKDLLKRVSQLEIKTKLDAAPADPQRLDEASWDYNPMTELWIGLFGI